VHHRGFKVGKAMHAIEVANLTKHYGSHAVLEGISLFVDAGELYALMGPNGSGKTALSSIIASVTAFDSGTVAIHGKRPEQVKRLVGYVPQSNFSVPQLTGRENLIYFAGLIGYSRHDARIVAEDILQQGGVGR